MAPGPRRQRLAAVSLFTSFLVALGSFGYTIAVALWTLSEDVEAVQVGLQTLWAPMLGTTIVSLQKRVLYGDREPLLLLFTSTIGTASFVIFLIN